MNKSKKFLDNDGQQNSRVVIRRIGRELDYRLGVVDHHVQPVQRHEQLARRGHYQSRRVQGQKPTITIKAFMSKPNEYLTNVLRN